jgi:hypothetical protein
MALVPRLSRDCLLYLYCYNIAGSCGRSNRIVPYLSTSAFEVLQCSDNNCPVSYTVLIALRWLLTIARGGNEVLLLRIELWGRYKI